MRIPLRMPLEGML